MFYLTRSQITITREDARNAHDVWVVVDCCLLPVLLALDIVAVPVVLLGKLISRCFK